MQALPRSGKTDSRAFGQQVRFDWRGEICNRTLGKQLSEGRATLPRDQRNSELRLAASEPNTPTHDVKRERDAGDRKAEDKDIARADNLHDGPIGAMRRQL